jgi:hypothetical protein
VPSGAGIPGSGVPEAAICPAMNGVHAVAVGVEALLDESDSFDDSSWTTDGLVAAGDAGGRPVDGVDALTTAS